MSSKLSDSEILNLLRTTNLNTHPPGNRTSRWPENAVTVQLADPAPDSSAHKVYHALAKAAVREFNRRLKGIVALNIVSGDDAQIRITFGTAYVPTAAELGIPLDEMDYQNFVANVAVAPSVGTDIRCDDAGAIATRPVYLNIGHAFEPCHVNRDTVIHEFGHALGLLVHFKGFGIGQAISDDFWDLIATLYGNAAATPFDNLTVHRL